MNTSIPQEHRIPMGHPEYRYPVSKNPYWAKLRDDAPVRARVFCDNETEERKGAWRAAMPDAASAQAARALHVEVGCNGGHVILEWAAHDPQAAYVGLDWKFKQIHRGAEKAAKRGLRNLVFFRANSERLHYMFAPGEVDFLYLYFPDPWAKKSQLKNRWFTTERLQAIASIVKPGGVFHVKTDHAGYFDWMLEHAAAPAAQALWKATEITRDLHAGNPDARKLTMPEVTLFERLFIAKGLPVHSMKLIRS